MMQEKWGLNLCRPALKMKEHNYCDNLNIKAEPQDPVKILICFAAHNHNDDVEVIKLT